MTFQVRNNFMKSSILIGSNGYLGKHLSVFLDQNGFNNLNSDIQSSAFNGTSNYQQLDVTDESSFQYLNPNIDFIFMFAGITGTVDGFDKVKEFININEVGLLNLLNWIRATKSNARIIFPSTRLVYQGRKNYLLKEEDPKEVKTIYALNKLAAENLLWMYYNAFGINYTIFRICVPYGNIFGGAYSYGTIGFFINKASINEDIVLFGDGSVKRTFTYVDDICTAICDAIHYEGSINQIFNIGGENMTLLKAAMLVAKKFGVGIKFTPWPAMVLKLESDDTMFDDSKLRSLITIANKYDLQRWLASYS